MSKQTTQYACTECGSIYPKWIGKCDACNNWNTLVAEEVVKTTSSHPEKLHKKKTPIPLSDIKIVSNITITTEFQEFNTLLGKGFVQGSVVLLGGEPGIGKSTLALQLAHQIGLLQEQRILYISGEESETQIFKRAKRLLKNIPDNILVLCEIDMSIICEVIDKYRPTFIIIDSIQVVYHKNIPSAAGSINQIRYCTLELVNRAKELNICTIIIGHITKDGSIAGPKVLEHMVDVVLFFEGERNQKYRVLRCFKNRFSNTDEIALFEMEDKGLQTIKNYQDLFIDSQTMKNPGSMVVPVMFGGRVILIEIQALVINSGYGMAKRTFNGVDQRRINLLIAATEKMTNITLSTKDIFINVIGGLKITEPAIDLGIILAMVSSTYEKPLNSRLGVLGEVGLTGEVRPITNFKKRILELNKMNFDYCICPAANKSAFPADSKELKVHPIYVSNINEAIKNFIH